MIPDLLLDFIAASIATLPVVWLAGFGFLPTVNSLSQLSRRSVRVVSSRNISDHWKEKVVSVYALKLFGFTIKLALFILGLLLVFVLTWVGVVFVLGGESGIHRLLHWETQATIALAGTGLGLIRWYRAK